MIIGPKRTRHERRVAEVEQRDLARETNLEADRRQHPVLSGMVPVIQYQPPPGRYISGSQ